MAPADATASPTPGSPGAEAGGPGDSLTRLLHAVEEGPADVRERAWGRIYPELLRIAATQRRRWRGDWTLDTRGLASEAYLRFFAASPVHFENRRHFFLAVARGIRRILLNYSAAQGAAKRGGGMQRVSIPDSGDLGRSPSPSPELESLAEAVSHLEAMDPRAGEIVHLRFFVGLTEEETADVLGVSRSTVSRDWAAARAWLWRELVVDQPVSGGTEG